MITTLRFVLTKYDEEFLYKIIFVDRQVNVEEEKERSNSAAKTKNGRELKSTKDPTMFILFYRLMNLKLLLKNLR